MRTGVRKEERVQKSLKTKITKEGRWIFGTDVQT